MALVRDGTKSIAGNAVFVTKLGEDWNNIHPHQPGIAEALRRALRRSLVVGFASLYVLAAPTWLVLGLLGSILMLIGRKKKPLIGYGRD